MEVILSMGLLIFCGYILGEFAEKLGLPKISGYIISGVLLNPGLTGILSDTFVQNTSSLLSITLSVIVFSIGGSLSYKKIKETGKSMMVLTIFESLLAFLSVFIFAFLTLYFILHIYTSVHVIVAVSLILASLAAPTDPSATIAVIHEFKAKGKVSSSMLGIAAFDDVTGIIIYTLTIAFAASFMGNSSFEVSSVLLDLAKNIGGSLLVGILLGIAFKYVVSFFKKDTDGSLIVLVLGMILLSYGISDYFGLEPLLTSMTLGAMVVNTNRQHTKIFNLLERYTDELIFVVFFSLSGLHLDFKAVGGSLLIIVMYIAARMLGKFSGIYIGANLQKNDAQIKKYTAWGLFPQGGIVIGLALLLKENPAFNSISSTIIGIVIGTALVHEILGPILSKTALKKAGEIK